MPVEWPRSAGAEDALPRWGWRLRQTLAALLRRPRQSFAYVQEPVDHGTALRLLLTLRLPVWMGLLAALWAQGPRSTTPRPAFDTLDVWLADALSLWALLMVPVGVPLLYAVLGIATHVALVLSGGAPRSIAATMRAVGYSFAPPLLGAAILDLPLHLGGLSSTTYFAAMGALSLLFFVLAGNALKATHQISWIRGFAAALTPVGIFAVLQFLRAYLVLPELPWWSPPIPGGPYFVP